MQRTTRPPVSLLDPYTGSEPLPLYTTTAVVTGGESAHGRSSGHARAATGELDLPLRLLVELGGGGWQHESGAVVCRGVCSLFSR